jgi:DNA-binding MarR family transcriptional regulator
MKVNPTPRNLLAAVLGLNVALERRSEGFFQPFGITGAQFNILNLLAERTDSMDQAELVEQLLVGKSSVSIVINRMVRNGLLRREEHPKDRRQTVLFLTPVGRQLWERVFPPYAAGVEDIFGILKTADRGVFLRYVEAIEDRVRENEAAAPKLVAAALVPQAKTKN